MWWDLDVAAELPETPDLILDNFGALDSAAAVDRIWSRCVRVAGRARATHAPAPGLHDQGRVARDARAAFAAPRESCRRSGSRSAIGAPSAAARARRDPRRSPGARARSSFGAARRTRTARRARKRDDTTRYSTLSARSVITRDRGRDRLVRRRRQRPRSDLRAADARARRDGRRRVLAHAQRRRPLLRHQLRRSVGPHRRGHRRHGRQSRDLLVPASRATDACPPSLAPGHGADGRARGLARLRRASTWNSRSTAMASSTCFRSGRSSVERQCMSRRCRSRYRACGRRPQGRATRAGRIRTCMAAARSSASCRTGIPPRSLDCGPGRCRCRCTAS